VRKRFPISAPVRRAMVYVTARGLYELRINGRRVGDHVLAPEWTGYHKRLQYQAYDVTEQLRTGENVIAALLGAGWYAGRIGLFQARQIYGKVPQLLVRLDVELADGRTETVVSDASWRHAPESPFIAADLLDGEVYDARKEPNRVGDLGVATRPNGGLAGQTSPPARRRSAGPSRQASP